MLLFEPDEEGRGFTQKKGIGSKARVAWVRLKWKRRRKKGRKKKLQGKKAERG
jgi:hypothetical protein